MVVECCDLCKKKMCNYTDDKGVYWEGISFQSKKYRRRVCFMADAWTEYLSICGRCRAEIANKRSEDECNN